MPEEKYYCEICGAFYVSKAVHDDIVAGAIKGYRENARLANNARDKTIFTKLASKYARHNAGG